MQETVQPVPEPHETAKARGPARLRLPSILGVLSIVALIAVWTWPAFVMGGWVRVTLTYLILLIDAAVVVMWFVFFSGTRFTLRAAVVALLIAAGIGFRYCVRKVDKTGDMWMSSIEFVWSPTRDDRLESHRRQQAATAPKLEATAGSIAGGFPEYRGPNRDGILVEETIARDWNTHPPRQLWRQPSGGGYAAFVIVEGSAITIEQRRDREAVVCYAAETGQELWVHDYPAHFQESMGGDGPRATPTIADADVVSLGAGGELCCLDRNSGELRWRTNILADAGAKNLTWGMSGSPLVFDGRVVVNPGGPSGNAVAAYNRESGERIWSTGSAPAGYTSPMLVSLGGERQILVFDGSGVAGYEPSDGDQLWRYPWVTNQGINVAQPLVLAGSDIFISSGYGVGGARLHLESNTDQWNCRPLWQSKNLRCKMASPVVHEGCIYGLDEGIMTCLDAQTGRRLWKRGRYGHGQILLIDDLILVLSEQGDLALVQASSDAYHELGRINVLTGRTWNNPALAGGILFVRNHLEMAAYDLRPIAQAP